VEPESRDNWTRELSRVTDEVEHWSRDEGWLVARQAKEISEDGDFAPYRADVLTIETPQGRLRLDPVGRFVFGALGRLDLYAWPSLHRFMLVRQEAGWALRTDSGVNWPKPWGHETFVELARELVRAA
jgi:hypothetical protein